MVNARFLYGYLKGKVTERLDVYTNGKTYPDLRMIKPLRICLKRQTVQAFSRQNPMQYLPDLYSRDAWYFLLK